MRHEPGHRESVTESFLPLLENMDRKILALSAAGDLGPAIRDLLLDAKTIRAACGAVRDFQPLGPVIKEFENRLEELLRESRIPDFEMESRLGGLLLQSVGAFRQAVLHLGTGTRQAETVSRILRELQRALALSVQVERLPEHQYDEIEELFLREGGQLLVRLDEFSKALAVASEAALTDDAALAETFRIVHTLKGNASIAGFSAMSEYADAVESALSALKSSRLPRDEAAAKFLVSCFGTMKDAFALYRADTRRPIDLSAKAAAVRSAVNAGALVQENKMESPGRRPMPAPVEHAGPASAAGAAANAGGTVYVLLIRAAAKTLAIPCDSVQKVLRKPIVLPVPNARSGWLGAVNVAGNLMPLLDPHVFVGAPAGTSTAEGREPLAAEWVVVISAFAVAVEQVHGVIEVRQTKSNMTVLDIPTMIRNAEAA